jgi:hypothetical protein
MRSLPTPQARQSTTRNGPPQEPLSQRQLVEWSLLTCPERKKGSPA